jgi:small-conductance mechanosensitive channel
MFRHIRQFWPCVCRPGLLVLCLCLIAGAARADATPPPSPPAGMSQPQYDALVKAVGESVLQTLQEKGLVAKAAPAAPPASPSTADAEAVLAQKMTAAFARIPAVLAGYRDIGQDLVRLFDRLDLRASGGRGTWGYLGLLFLVAAVGLLAERSVGRVTAAAREALVRRFAVLGGWWRVPCVAALDGLGVLALWAVVHLAPALLFARAGGQTELASVVLRSLVAWRAYMLLFRIYLRPAQPAIRLVPAEDGSARRIYRLFELAVLVAVLSQTWHGLLVTPAALDAAVLTNSLLLPAILIHVVLRARRDIAAWFVGLIEGGSGKHAIKTALALHWHWIALPILVVLAVARIYDALSVEFEMPSGVILTLNIVVGLALAETLWSFIIRSARAATGAAEGGRLLPFLVRAARATLWVAAAGVLVRIWAVDVLAVVDEQAWSNFSHAWRTAIVTALGAYLAWEAVHFATEPLGGRRTAAAVGPASEEASPAQAPLSASRLETLAPILRMILGTVIVVMAGLTILASLDISITPFIAGASVVGLAISFGSQTLVHDIVSGLFYLADDAFRVGEYIDCGKGKGTVEGFTLRSIRLRHQSGQIHTIPFGQLGQITNFSRDWSTLKFNLRFDRNTDIEKLRKTTKKVGLAMAEDAELKDDIIDPLKLQGIADIADSATIMRFKITVRPTRPSFIQREAVKRLIAAYKEAGIEFASATVAVQAVGGQAVEAAAAAAAASKSGEAESPAPAL